MVTISNFKGRTGNKLFQWAFLSSLARKHNVEYVLPESNLFDYFEKPKTGTIETEITVNELGYGYYPLPYDLLDYSKNIDFKGYYQSEKYWDEKVLEEIKFKPELIEAVKTKYAHLLNKSTIAIGVRRGDYLKEPHVYYQLGAHYYISALEHQFPEWRSHNIIFISDDMPYCRLHFSCLKNAFFPEGTDIEHMVLMSLCENIIIPNSTFHFWAAKLGNPKKVVQPTKLFAGELLRKHGDINFYSDKWVKHEECRIDLRDVTFTIPVQRDSVDREENLKVCIDQLQKYFYTKIIVGENKELNFNFMPVHYMGFNSEQFHRTRMLNEMAKASTTRYIANWDADIIIPPMQIYEAVMKLRQGAEMVYPYEWNFIRISRKLMKEMASNYDIGVYGKYNFPTNDAPGKPSVGGAVLWNRESFMRIGMENEYMISFGPEDVERHERAKALGVRIERVPGDLWHFNHWCGPDSSVSNPLFKANRALLEKQRAMSKEQLIEYIDSWPWFSPYTEVFHESITEEAIRSRDEVFKILGINGEYIGDFGAGLCQWGVGLKNYTGIDFRIPKEKLLVDQDKYVEWDLRVPIPEGFMNVDIVLCLETGEHLEEKYADTLISSLCASGKTIIFSAAIPMQGGNGHVNEQFQTYWAEKFAKHGYGPDENQYRKEIRSNPDISLWYKQNLVIYKKGGAGEVEDFVLPEYYYQIVKGLKQKT